MLFCFSLLLFVVMIYVIGFVIIYKVEQTSPVVYSVLIWLYNMGGGSGKMTR